MKPPIIGAIYGVWDRNAASYANAARLEWIRDLAAHGDHKLLLGELLPLEAETQDFAVLLQVADYLRTAGSPVRAAELYNTLLATHPSDTRLLKGLGEAETDSGRYGAAQNAFLRAFQLSPGDASIRQAMELTSALSAMDPTLRRLASRTKYERSAHILRLVRESVEACGTQTEAATRADRLLNLKHIDISNESAEEVLQLAESLWRSRPPSCPAPAMLPILMKKLAQ